MNEYKQSKAQLNDLKRIEKTRVSRTHLFKVIYVIALVILVNSTYILAFPIRYGANFVDSSMNNFNAYLASMPVLTISALVLIDLFQMTHFYRRTYVHIINNAIKFAFLQTLATTTSAFFMRAFAFPRAIIVVGFFVIFILTSLLGIFGLWVNKKLYNEGQMVIVGTSEDEIKQFIQKTKNNLKTHNTSVLAACTIEQKEQLFSSIDKATELVICPGISEQDKSDLLLYASEKNKVVFLVPSFFDLALWRAPMVQFDDTASFMIQRIGLTFEQRMIKRMFDIIVSLLAIIITSPIMLAAFIAVKITSPGPAVFKQERITLNSRVYNIYKFRTMRTDAESLTGPVISGAKDPRVTKIGGFLRKSKIDELPQFFNVLKGDMSIVGPRSEREFFVRQFGEAIPGYNNRFKVKAGITGYAQIAGKYDTTAEDKLRYDLAYIKNYSIIFDLRLMLETIKVIFRSNLFNKEFGEDVASKKAVKHDKNQKAVEHDKNQKAVEHDKNQKVVEHDKKQKAVNK